MALIFEDVHLGRSVLPPHAVPSKPTLVRWDGSRPLTIENCVVMDHKEAEKHQKSIQHPRGTFVDPKEIWGADVQGIVTRRAKELERQKQWVMP